MLTYPVRISAAIQFARPVSLFTFCVCAALLGLPRPAASHAAELRVDIGQNATNTVTPEDGFFGYTDTSSNPSPFAADFGTAAGNVTVGISGSLIHYRSRPSNGYPQVNGHPGFNNLLSGSVLMNHPNSHLQLQLSDLADGQYMLTTIHHTNYNGNTLDPKLDITSSDANGASILRHQDVPVTEGTTPTAFTTRITPFSVSGGSITTFTFDPVSGVNAEGRGHATLNAFVVTDVSDGPPPLRIDFGRSVVPGPTQAGFQAFEGEGTGLISRSFLSTHGKNGLVGVSIEGQQHFRDYAPATGIFDGQSDLLSDGVLRSSEGSMMLTLSDLADGDYLFTGYMHTTEWGASTPGYGPATPFDVFLTDGLVTDQQIVDGAFMSDGGSSALSMVKFLVEVQNGSPVMIDFQRRATIAGNGDHMTLAGFELTAVPEPANWAQLGIALIGMLGWIGWRRVKR